MTDSTKPIVVAPMPGLLTTIDIPSRISRRPLTLSAAPDALGLFKALRRRWVPAIGLGLLLAAVIGPATWRLVPKAKYTAKGSMQVATRPKRIMFEPNEGMSEFRTYQKTQQAMVKNRKILNHALSQPEIARLQTVAEQVDADEWLEEQLKVEFAGGSEIMQISLSGDRPEDLAKIVNSVIKSYMYLSVEQEHQDRVERLEKLKKLLEKYQSELILKRKSLKELASSLGSSDQVTVAVSQQFRAEHLAMAQKERLRAQSELMHAKAELDVAGVSSGRTAGPARVPAQVVEVELERQPEVIRSRDQLAAMERRYAAVARIVRQPRDTSLVEAQRMKAAASASLQEIRARLRPAIAEQARARPGGAPSDLARLKQQVDVWAAYRDAMDLDIKQLQAETKQVSEKGLDLENEREEIAVSNDVARKVGAEVEAVQVELAAPRRIQVLADAVIPKKKDELRNVKAGGGAALFAFLAGLIGVSFWEFRARRIDTVDEVVQGLGLRVVGALPALPARSPRRAGVAAGAEDLRWRSLLVESVDATRTMLLHASVTEAVRVVMITSAVPREGKTSLSCHLATSLARSGRRTLLIDCDLRLPTAHRLYDQPLSPGLCELIRGEAGLAEAIRETSPGGPFLLPAGRRDPATLQLIARDGLRALLEELKAQFDFVIVDSAPILPVADSLLIGQSVDAVLFSVLREVSRMPTVYAAYERLEVLGIKILGAVVSGIRSPEHSYSYISAPAPGE